jgi:hypothetical protein
MFSHVVAGFDPPEADKCLLLAIWTFIFLNIALLYNHALG